MSLYGFEGKHGLNNWSFFSCCVILYKFYNYPLKKLLLKAVLSEKKTKQGCSMYAIICLLV